MSKPRNEWAVRLKLIRESQEEGNDPMDPLPALIDLEAHQGDRKLITNFLAPLLALVTSASYMGDRQKCLDVALEMTKEPKLLSENMVNSLIHLYLLTNQPGGAHKLGAAHQDILKSRSLGLLCWSADLACIRLALGIAKRRRLSLKPLELNECLKVLGSARETGFEEEMEVVKFLIHFHPVVEDEPLLASLHQLFAAQGYRASPVQVNEDQVFRDGLFWKSLRPNHMSRRAGENLFAHVKTALISQDPLGAQNLEQVDQFLASQTEPFDAFIDGANVAHLSGSFSFHPIQAVYDSLISQGRHPCVVLHSKWFKHEMPVSAVAAKYKKSTLPVDFEDVDDFLEFPHSLLEECPFKPQKWPKFRHTLGPESKGSEFYLRWTRDRRLLVPSPSANDDLYFLYATLYSMLHLSTSAVVISNDRCRDHRMTLGQKRSFDVLRDYHFVRPKISVDDQIEVQYEVPLSVSQVSQCSPDMKEVLFRCPYEWLAFSQ